MRKADKLTPAAIASLTVVANGNLQNLWDNADDYGSWISKEDLPEVDPEELAESGLIEDEERCEALANGAEPSKKEIKIYHDHWLEAQLDGTEDPDTTAYGLASVDDGNGNQGVALLLCTGTSWEGISVSLSGIYGSSADATRYLKKEGWIL